jgi:hypothetical protein
MHRMLHPLHYSYVAFRFMYRCIQYKEESFKPFGEIYANFYFSVKEPRVTRSPHNIVLFLVQQDA